MNTLAHSKKRRERGQALAEFSLILPILLMVVFGIIDFGRVIFVFSDAAGALRDAAREANILGMATASVPSYADCDTIRATALGTHFVSNEVVDVYYWDTTNPAVGLTPFNAAQAQAASASGDPADMVAFLQDAHYSCEGGLTVGGGIPDVGTGGVLDNGDIMRVHYTGRINFMTPFLSQIWSGIDLNFYAERTVVTKLTLGSTDGIDYDYDGLDDRWEFMWFGCIDQDDDTTIHYVDDQFKYQPLDTWESWTVDGGLSWQDEHICDSRDVDNPDGDIPDTVPIPYEINTDAYNAIRDPDGDDCNMGCEENRNSNPLVVEGVDSDGDGLTDGEEVNLYYTSPTGGDWTYCDNNQRVGADDGSTYPATSDGVPDGYDSDCDGVPDGVEIGSDRDPAYGGQIEPNSSTYTYPGKEFPYSNPAIVGWPYRPSLALVVDGADADTYYDSVDSDGDGIYDHAEYYDSTPCSGPEVGDRPLEATPYECHPDLTRTPTFPVNQYFTNPSYYDELPPVAELDGVDTDGDGLTDYEEIQGGFVRGPFSINRGVPQTYTYYTHPNYADGDNDGLSDFEEVTNLVGLGIWTGYTDPQNPDTDGDSINDGDEIDAGTNPLDDDSDFDNLSDFLEQNLVSTAPYNSRGYAGNPSPTDPNSDGDGGADEDADGYPDALTPATNELLPGETTITPNACRNMNDGYEANILFTDPTTLDSDGDDASDCWELDSNLNPNNPNSDGGTVGTATEELDGNDCAPHDPARVTCSADDTDLDGLPDWWEEASFGVGNLSQVATGDPDNDTCNNLCEYQRGTNPNLADTDGDGLNDGIELPDSSPTNFDTDGDGLSDGAERNYVFNGVPSPLNARSSDSDGDGISDFNEVNTYHTNAADADTDGDFIFDQLELFPTAYGTSFPGGYMWNGESGDLGSVTTNPLLPDTDGDGWTDYEEIFTYYSLQPNPTDIDTDDDGLNDSVEGGTSGSNTLVNDADTDNDGLNDGVEYLTGMSVTINFCAASGNPQTITLAGLSTNLNGLNPNSADTDGDGLLDGAEVNNADAELRTNPLLSDTDNDGIGDASEVNDGNSSTDPQCGGTPVVVDDDTDNDCLTDAEETAGFVLTGWGSTPITTDPNNADSDGDGISDPVEMGISNADCTATVKTLNITYKNTSGTNTTINQTPFITNPTQLDGNGDGQDDGYDSDLDGMSDNAEYLGTVIYADCSNPRDGDYTDTGDLNGVTKVTNPADLDTDGDGMPDLDEIENHVNPLDGTCGPALVLAKTNTILDTVLNMFWRNHSSTATMTPDDAEAAAVTYAVDNGGFVASGLIMQVRFRASGSCGNPGDMHDEALAVGATWYDEASVPGNKCDSYIEVTIDQLVSLAFLPMVLEVGNP